MTGTDRLRDTAERVEDSRQGVSFEDALDSIFGGGYMTRMDTLERISAEAIRYYIMSRLTVEDFYTWKAGICPGWMADIIRLTGADIQLQCPEEGPVADSGQIAVKVEVYINDVYTNKA